MTEEIRTAERNHAKLVSELKRVYFRLCDLRRVMKRERKPPNRKEAWDPEGKSRQKIEEALRLMFEAIEEIDDTGIPWPWE